MLDTAGRLGRIALAVGAVGIASVTMSGASVYATQPAPGPQQVEVVNGTAKPVPTAAQGTTQVAGTVQIAGTPTVTFPPGQMLQVFNTDNSPLIVANRQLLDSQGSIYRNFVLKPGEDKAEALAVSASGGLGASVEYVSVKVRGLPGETIMPYIRSEPECFDYFQYLPALETRGDNGRIRSVVSATVASIVLPPGCSWHVGVERDAAYDTDYPIIIDVHLSVRILHFASE